MSKPKQGYKRKSVDIKAETLIKIEKAVIGKPETPKEYIEQLIEKHAKKLN